MEENSIVRSAGVIARFFNIDPMIVLKSNFKDYAIRAGAYRYVAQQEDKARQKAAAEQKQQR